MSTYYGSIGVTYVGSENVDYSEPAIPTPHINPFEFGYDNGMTVPIHCVITSGTTIDLGIFSAIVSVVIKNTSSEAGKVTYGYLGSTQVAPLPAYGVVVLGAITVADDLKITSLGSNSILCQIAIFAT